MKQFMKQLHILVLITACFCTASFVHAQTIAGPDVRIENNDIYVSFGLTLEEKHLQEINEGIEKELKMYVDLFRVWKIWPNEFVLGKSYVRTIHADPIKKELFATSFDGATLIQKRFKSLTSMLTWVLSVQNLKLTNIRELEGGPYFVRITIESKIRQLPPIIGHLLIFVTENEFKVVKDSAIFSIETAK